MPVSVAGVKWVATGDLKVAEKLIGHAPGGTLLTG